MIARCILILGTLPLCSLLAQEISMDLSPEECAPGDLVRLRFHLESKVFTEMLVTFLNPEGIHLVATEKRPIEFNPQTQFYEQNENWIVQAMHSGEFLFSELVVTLEGLVDVEPIKIEPIQLTVTGYAETEDSPTPEVWPTYLENHKPTSRWLWGAVISAICFAFYRLIQSKKKVGLMQQAVAEEDPLSQISRRLRCGDFPADTIDSWLKTDDAQGKLALRASLEQALYAKTYDRDTLLEHLDKEAQA